MNAVRKPKKTAPKKNAKPLSKSDSAISGTQVPAAKTTKTPQATAAKAAPAKPAPGFSLEPIFAAIRKRLPASRQAEAKAFAESFYKRMEDDEYPHHAPEAWAALACDMLDFARVRKPGTANVRVFNATLKANGWESPHTVLQIVNDDMPFLVDSVSMALADAGIGVHVLGHPLLRFSRDKAGKLTRGGRGQARIPDAVWKSTASPPSRCR